MQAKKTDRRPAAHSSNSTTSTPLIGAAVASWEADALMQEFDPRKLKPGETVRLLNSSPLGPVVTQRQLDRHRELAGFRIGDGKSIDFFRYVGWLFDRRHAPATQAAGHAPMLSKQAKYSRGKTAESADIGEIRAVANAARREACRNDLSLFLTIYFPHSTGKNPLSKDHKRLIARLQDIVLRGGRLANAIYRGFAKTTLAENTAIWAVLYGHREFVVLLGATSTLAKENIESIKSELETNDLIDEDFPEVTQAIRALEGKPQRCKSQTCGGELTHIVWTSKKIVLPSIEGSVASGAIIIANGITAASRGLKHKRSDGKNARPDLVMVDDPQTDESAEKPARVKKRIDILRKVVLKLAGHQKQIACVVNGTIIQKDDMMDLLTDGKKNPSFQHERIKMVKSWATVHETEWLGPYTKIRTSYDPDDPDDQARAHRQATEYYEERREAMDAGCAISWEYCFDPETEISAIQHAYNMLIDDGADVFAAECQGEPRGNEADEDAPRLTGIADRINQLPRGKVPIWAERLVGFVDVQSKVLYYAVMAFKNDFTGALIDYGTWPEQPRDYFALRDVSRTLQQELARAGKQGGQEAAIMHGLQQLEQTVLVKTWEREDKGEQRIERFMPDSGWQTDTVYEYCRRSPHGGVLMPSKGHAVNAAGKPMTEWEIKDHERPGFHFVVTTDPTRRAVRLIKYDTHFWKTFVANRLATLGPGTLSVFGTDPGRHKMLADHFKSEFCTKTEGRGRTVWDWKVLPGQDNHLLDCVVGCYAAAALQGCRLGENRTATVPKKKRRISYF